MFDFCLWVIVRDPIFQQEISTVLINKGFSIASLASNGKVCQTENDLNRAAHTLAYQLSPAAADIKFTALDLTSEISKALDKSKVKHLGLLVIKRNSEFEAGWMASNAKMEQDINIIINNTVAQPEKKNPTTE